MKWQKRADVIGYTLKIPAELYERIRLAAYQARQSVRMWMLAAAEQRLRREKEKEKP